MTTTQAGATDLQHMLESDTLARGWPEGLLARAVAAHTPLRLVRAWLDEDVPPERVEREVADIERLTSGTLHMRVAMHRDDERLVDLFADSPEGIGDWEVTVERGPNPFAQARLQENGYIVLLEDRGVALAATQRSTRETVVGGRHMRVSFRSAQRVRRSARGQGYSRLLGGMPATEPFAAGAYYHLRADNENAVAWLRHQVPDAASLQSEIRMPGLPTLVFRLPPAAGASAAGIRLARRSDVRRCVALINRTHRGHDFFRPYTPESLARCLEDPLYHVTLQARDEAIYGWRDYHALEEAGTLVACAGLWDRGRDIREVWRHKTTGESFTRAATGLMDFGYAEGREDAMASLIAYLQSRTAEVGRDHLMAPLQHLPALADRVGAAPSDAELRWLIWYRQDTPNDVLDTDVTSPYTDLRYW